MNRRRRGRYGSFKLVIGTEELFFPIPRVSRSTIKLLSPLGKLSGIKIEKLFYEINKS